MDEQERPVEVERETTIIQTGNGGGGGAGLLAIVVLLVLAIAAFLYLGGYLQRAADEVDVNVNVAAPNVELPDIKIEQPKSEPAEAPANSN
ncbi:MAG TPA: hypothetical protein VLK25_10110 [Allosphingosinicella sp.]|nr:hypothetical protein [Allosphingosinicella sp.]